MQILKGTGMTAIFLAVDKAGAWDAHKASSWLRWSPSVPESPWLVITPGHSKVSYILEARPGSGMRY